MKRISTALARRFETLASRGNTLSRIASRAVGAKPNRRVQSCGFLLLLGSPPLPPMPQSAAAPRRRCREQPRQGLVNEEREDPGRGTEALRHRAGPQQVGLFRDRRPRGHLQGFEVRDDTPLGPFAPGEPLRAAELARHREPAEHRLLRPRGHRLGAFPWFDETLSRTWATRDGSGHRQSSPTEVIAAIRSTSVFAIDPDVFD